MSENEPMRGDSIRLTNLTARALRRCALRERGLCRAVTVVLTLSLAGVSVGLGVYWHLMAVPLVLLLAALLDALLLMLGRSRYLTLIGQAICTEAAARDIRERSDEKRRRRQALSDLAGIREDMKRMNRVEPERRDPDEEDDDLLPESSVKKPPETRIERPQAAGDTRRMEKQTEKRTEKREAPQRRRRRQAAFQVIEGERMNGDAVVRHPEARP